MHIAINGWFWDQPNVGSGQYLRELLKALVRLNNDARYTLILPAHIQSPEGVPDAVTVVHAGGRLGGKIGKVWFEQNQYPAAVKHCKADIAHVPYFAPPLNVSAKLVTSVLDVVPLMFPEYAGGTLTKLYTSMARAAAQGSAYILTLSEASKVDVAAQLDFPAERIVAVHLAPKEDYHPQMGRERDADVRKKYALPDDRFILYLGGFDVRKRVRQLISAYKYVVKAHGEYTPLVIAGREPEWREPLFPDVRAYAVEEGIPEENIYWIGYVDEADKPSLYRLADVFVFPSAYEGFGLPLLEAMASGTPTVANNIPVFDELVGDGAFLIEDGSATKMGGALLALLEQPDLYESVRNNGIGRASSFMWRKTAKETFAVYEQALR